MQKAISLPLGDLELQVMEHLWSSGQADVRSTHEALGGQHSRKLNTVQSTLDRLFRKGLLDRKKISRAFVYSAKVDRESLLLGSMQSIADTLGEVDRGALLASFLELHGEDDAELDRLQALINAHRAKNAER